MTGLAAFRAMGSQITLRTPGRAVPAGALARAREIFREVERAATRFSPDSPLMRCNRNLGRWMDVPPLLLEMLDLAEAWRKATGGLFDPRILPALSRAGYRGAEALGPLPHGPGPDPWYAAERAGSGAARLCLEWPVDLGGMGKGFACDLAAEALRAQLPCFLLDAGGDICLHGPGAGPDGDWPIGVEDPRGGRGPLAVVRLRAPGAVATSSVARRQWQGPGGVAHHLIDPRTLRPAEVDLLAVSAAAATVLAAEIAAKTLFIAGRSACAATEGGELPVWWVGGEGALCGNAAARQRVIAPGAAAAPGEGTRCP